MGKAMKCILIASLALLLLVPSIVDARKSTKKQAEKTKPSVLDEEAADLAPEGSRTAPVSVLSESNQSASALGSQPVASNQPPESNSPPPNNFFANLFRNISQYVQKEEHEGKVRKMTEDHQTELEELRKAINTTRHEIAEAKEHLVRLHANQTMNAADEEKCLGELIDFVDHQTSSAIHEMRLRQLRAEILRLKKQSEEKKLCAGDDCEEHKKKITELIQKERKEFFETLSSLLEQANDLVPMEVLEKINERRQIDAHHLALGIVKEIGQVLRAQHERQKLLLQQDEGEDSESVPATPVVVQAAQMSASEPHVAGRVEKKLRPAGAAGAKQQHRSASMGERSHKVEHPVEALLGPE